MWSHKSALLLMAAVCLAAEMDITLVNLPGSGSCKRKTSCAIVRNADHSQIPSDKTCVIYEDPYDYNIHIGTLSISAHIKVLAASIPYFEDSSTSIQSKTQALLKEGLNPIAVKLLFRYAYTRKVKIYIDNANNILKAANFLNIQKVVSICTDFLISRINNRNVIEIINNEESNRNVTRMRIAAENYIQQHFADVALENEFVNWDSAVFLRIMRSNLIRNVSEESVFDAAFKWITYNETDRRALSYQIMENVRLPIIDNNYLIYNVTPKLLGMRNNHIRQLLYEATDYQYSPDDRSDLHGCRTWPRNGTNKFVNFRWVNANTPIQMYEPGVRRLEYADNSLNKSEYALLIHNCKLFAFGGRDTKSVNIYNPVSNSWSDIEPMMEKRSSPAAAVSNGVIFVSGGYDGRNVISSTESYNIRSFHPCWKQLAPMAQKRWGHRLVTIADFVYAIGGCDGQDLKSVEIYDISKNKWSIGPSMKTARRRFGAALLHGKLYVCGGYASGIQLAEVFDPTKQTWTALPQLKTQKYIASLVVYKYKLYAFSSAALQSEVYDPETNTWSDLPDTFALDGEYWETLLMNF